MQSGPVTVRVSQEAEDAVRRYLEIVANGGAKPQKQPTVDADAIRVQYDDPLEALKAISVAMKEAAATEDPEKAFIRYAKTWAEHNGVTRDAFRAMGVKPAVLQKVYGDGATASGPATRAPAEKRSRVDGGALGKAILALPSGTRVTASMVVEDFGGTAQTARKILDQLSKGGELVALGRDPDHSSKGPAPKVWARV